MTFNPKQPLWLPQGSVRAILALLVVAVALFHADGAALERMAELVFAFYFISKVAQNK